MIFAIESFPFLYRLLVLILACFHFLGVWIAILGILLRAGKGKFVVDYLEVGEVVEDRTWIGATVEGNAIWSKRGFGKKIKGSKTTLILVFSFFFFSFSFLWWEIMYLFLFLRFVWEVVESYYALGLHYKGYSFIIVVLVLLLYTFVLFSLLYMYIHY